MVETNDHPLYIFIKSFKSDIIFSVRIVVLYQAFQISFTDLILNGQIPVVIQGFDYRLLVRLWSIEYLWIFLY